ncbi:SGNH/GDSL hydrolase family protein [Armatimonas rosea]|uniref:Lysophospholipase L1-like esterase n=1 Tax=Armatimonas rosea TaxID=685828 RepID=A0A7W9W6V0_ARMRO|nr:GDSL-type esterase/lipase family protein [Armatimonas rosea]MBB6050445.1 lysophospholipase L1-like esterase [Armatimonas rosea]
MQPTVLVVGSSIFEQWACVLAVAPACRVVNRAIGGTVTTFWAEHLAAVLTEEPPDVVLFYCGSNDLNAEVPDHEIIANVWACRATLQAQVPHARLAYFGIIKAPQKLGKWEQIDSLNAAIGAQLAPGDLYVESNAVFFPEGAPLAQFFIEDGLHLTDDAYLALTDYARPLLAEWIF